MADANLMEKYLVCKRRGFVFPGSEIYGGFAGAAGDFGHWWRTASRENVKIRDASYA